MLMLLVRTPSAALSVAVMMGILETAVFVMVCESSVNISKLVWIVGADVDECVSDSPPCSINAECLNTLGSYICSCNPGYTGNGSHCRGNNVTCAFSYLN